MLKVLIADDEPLARMELKRLLARHEDLEVVAEAQNGAEALELLGEQDIDLAFIDIRMPKMDGLELARNIKGNTRFIFCTAYGEHAVAAFELNAFDYIVKPIPEDRLDRVIEKLRNTLAQAAAEAGAAENEPEEQGNQPLPDDHGLLLKFGDNYKIVRIGQIYRFQSVGNHVAVFSEQGQAFVLATLSRVESRLDPALFFKASRSVIVRVDQIRRIDDGMGTGTLLIQMKDGQEVTVSRRQAHLLRKRFSI